MQAMQREACPSCSALEKYKIFISGLTAAYTTNPNDNNTWHIDEEAAIIVRRILQMIIGGKGVNEIGRILRAGRVPIPSEHKKRTGQPVQSAKYADPYAWSTTTVIHIIERPEYMGKMVLGKTISESA